MLPNGDQAFVPVVRDTLQRLWGAGPDKPATAPFSNSGGALPAKPRGYYQQVPLMGGSGVKDLVVGNGGEVYYRSGSTVIKIQ
jgi:hypothetical protein